MSGRYLDRNSGTEIPSNLIFFDTESRSEPCDTTSQRRLLSLRLWCAVHVRLNGGKGHKHEIASGYSGESFWTWLDTRLQARKKTWLFAHNAAYDLTQLDFWGQLDANRYTIQPLTGQPDPVTGQPRTTWRGCLCLELSPFFISARSHRKTFNIVDTCNYWRMRLAELGEAIGLPKLPMPADDASDDAWLAYCHRDVEILVRAVLELMQAWSKEDCGVFQMTAPMLAMTSFRHLCSLKTPNGRKLDIICDPDSPAHDLERRAYYGGRTTCYQVGPVTGPVYHLDVNSLYPFVMYHHAYPRCYEFTKYGVAPADLRFCDGVYGIVAECLIDTRDETYPLRIGGEQYHCTGHYWTVLCGAELSRALVNGVVRRTGRVQYYSIATYFREWVDYWYGRKTRALRTVGRRDPVYQLAKIVLNSLSGKFAQRGRRWTDRFGCVPLLRWGAYPGQDPATGANVMARGVAGNLQTLSEVGEPRHSFPAITAFITAAGREYMQSLVTIAGEENVYYLAVDALIVSQGGYDRLERAGYCDEYELGKLKLLGRYEKLEVKGANYYTLDGIVTASGLLGVAERSKREGKPAELFDTITHTIARQPDGHVAVSLLPEPTFVPDYRGTLTIDGRWMPYRITMEPDWTDRPPRSGWASLGSLDTELVRTLQAGPL